MLLRTRWVLLHVFALFSARFREVLRVFVRSLRRGSCVEFGTRRAILEARPNKSRTRREIFGARVYSSYPQKKWNLYLFAGVMRAVFESKLSRLYAILHVLIRFRFV